MSKKTLLYTDNSWSFEKLKKVEDAIAKIAFDELKLDVYPNQIEIIGSDQMLDAYSSHGLPLMYNHWSFGKHFLQQENSYRKGHMGLAYEIVINSSPCISYLMEENSMTMQTLVIAHAAYGHNHFFKNNYLFRQWTDAEGILDYLQFAKNYIAKCEEKYGGKAVEETLDACHSISDYGIDKYTRPTKPSKKRELEQQKERELYVQQQANVLWSTLPSQTVNILDKGNDTDVFPKEPQDNILYFIEKHSPVLEGWQREVVRIVRKINQYFYPQRQTKLMNEGWASFTHYYIMNRLWEKGQISDGNYLEFIHSHSGVLAQQSYKSKYYNGFNPYALGFAIFSDIRRICTSPTDEDREYFPHLVNEPWLDVCLDAVRNFRDESFILQFLSPKIIREWGLFEITNNESDNFVSVSSIQNKTGYDSIRKTLSNQYSTSNYTPDIQIVNANLTGSRELELVYTPYNKTKLSDKNKSKVLSHIEYLWGYTVTLDESAAETQSVFMF
jgi:spore cortex formation protein SpoVR/YcgB (stage V sporulation)